MPPFKPNRTQVMHGSRRGPLTQWLSVPNDRHDWVLSSDGEVWILDQLEGMVVLEWGGQGLRVGFALKSDADLFAAALRRKGAARVW